jgi:hypothetical protein
VLLSLLLLSLLLLLLQQLRRWLRLTLLMVLLLFDRVVVRGQICPLALSVLKGARLGRMALGGCGGHLASWRR